MTATKCNCRCGCNKQFSAAELSYYEKLGLDGQAATCLCFHCLRHALLDDTMEDDVDDGGPSDACYAEGIRRVR